MVNGVTENAEQRVLLDKILNDKDLLQATYYYCFYLFEAIKKVGAPELFDVALKPWEKMIEDNMTTTLERFESIEKPTNSEVHPWSASPAFFYFNYLAGIQSVKNDFEEVCIAPAFGKLKTMLGLLPTSKETIEFKLNRTKNKLSAEITLPNTMAGNLSWQGTEITLKKGKNVYGIKNEIK